MNLPKKILQENDPKLRKTSKEVKFPLTYEIKDIIEKMINYVDNSKNEELSKEYDLVQAVGISAIQIGIPLNIIYIHTDKTRKILINSKIISHSSQKCALSSGEGCLSVKPQKIYKNKLIYRYNKVSIKTFDYFQKKFVIITLIGYEAIVLQHEMDHLKGILFIDYIKNNFINQPGLNPIIIN